MTLKQRNLQRYELKVNLTQYNPEAKKGAVCYAITPLWETKEGLKVITVAFSNGYEAVLSIDDIAKLNNVE